jgi:TP901 family phage tail tape measure protein
MTVGAIVAQLRLDMTNFREGLVKANSLLEQYSAQASRAATVLAGFAAAAGAGLGVAIKWSAEFEQQMRNVNSILHETEPNLRAIGDAVLEMAGKTGQAPATLARGLYDIASSGFEGAHGLKVLEAAAKAATAGLSDTATASRAITAVLNAYGMSASEAEHVSDVMFKTVERGVLTFGDLAQNLGDVVAMAATAKVPIEEVGAAIAAMTKAGIQPAEAFTSLNMVIRSLINPTEEAKAAAADMGVQWNASALAGQGLVGIFTDLGSVLKTSVKDVDALTAAGASEAEVMQAVAQNAGMTTEKLTALFPEVRGLRGALVLAAQGGEIFSEEFKLMAEATGSTAKAFAEQSKALALQWQKAWASIQALGIQVGTALLPVLKSFTNLVKMVVGLLRAMPAPLRTLVTVVAALAAGVAALAAAFILWNTQMRPAVPLITGMISSIRQMIAAVATANVTIAGSGKALAGMLASVKALAAGTAASAKAISVANVAFGALAVAAVAVASAAIKASADVEEFNDSLQRLEDRAQKARAEVQRFPEELKLTWAQAFLQRLTPVEGEITRLRREQMMLFEGGVELAERRRKAEVGAAEETEAAQRRLNELRQTALQNRLDEIEKERQARIKAGVDERLANELAEQERVAAHERANAEVLKLEAQLLEAEGKTHEARVKAIQAEAEEWRQQNEQKLGKERAAEAAERVKRAKLIQLAREEAQERAQAFEEAAKEVVSNWLEAADSMRQADRLSTSEYLSQLTKVLDLIRQIDAARAAAGQTRIFAQDEVRIAQTILAERKRMQTELEAGEKRLADARKEWAREELAERKRLNDYELSLIDLTFQHRRDLARLTGEEDEQTMARIAADELAALQQRRAEEQLSAQERLDSLERERQLILEMARAGEMPEPAARAALQSTFEAMQQAKEELAAQDRAAFEERRKQHEELLRQIEGEQKTLRDQLSETGGRIAQVAQSVFDVIEKRIRALGNIRLEPALAGGGLPGPGQAGRVFNFYLGERRLGETADIGRIADQLAEMLEREVTHSRD